MRTALILGAKWRPEALDIDILQNDPTVEIYVTKKTFDKKNNDRVAGGQNLLLHPDELSVVDCLV